MGRLVDWRTANSGRYSGVAQPAERGPVKPNVVGSSPPPERSVFGGGPGGPLHSTLTLRSVAKRGGSSVGQSSGLIICRPEVRVLPAPLVSPGQVSFLGRG